MKTRLTNKIFIVMILGLLFASHTYASVLENPNGNDSVYRYNALENKVSFADLFSNTIIDNSADKSPKIESLPDDATKNLQDITERQNFSAEQIKNAITFLQNRNGVITFLTGNKLGTLKFQMVQIKDQTTSLEALSLKTEYAKNKIQIVGQVKFLKEEQEKVENFIREKENEFSLFGWLAGSL